jgi:hypothetical protein
VPTRHGQKGRPRNVTSQGNAETAPTGKAAASHARMAPVSRALEDGWVREELQLLRADLHPGKHHSMSSFFERLAALRMMGGEVISDTTRLKDEALAAVFEWDAIAHPSTFGPRRPRCAGRMIYRRAGILQINFGAGKNQKQRQSGAGGWKLG